MRFIILLLAICGPILGQTYEQVAPKPVREGSPPLSAPTPPVAPVTETNPNEILVPTLTGLRLIPSLGELSNAAVVQSQPVIVEGLAWLEKSRAQAVAKEYLSRPLTRGGLSQLIRSMVITCRKADRPVVDIYAPPQDISTGVVQLVVLVGKLGKLQVEGNQWFASGILLKDMRLQPLHEITSITLLEDMDILNQNPFRQVDLVYARGEQYGTTDIILRVHDQRPTRLYLGYDDTGNATTGLGRAFAGINLGNLFHRDQQFGYQYTQSTEGNRLQAHSANYSMPLPWRNTVEVFGDWAKATTDPSGILHLTGISWQIGTRYTIPLPMLTPAFSHSVNFGFDYKWSNNNLDFGGVRVFASPINIAQGVLGYTAALVDAMGSTQASVSNFFSPGGLGGLNHDRDFAVSRFGAKAQYDYLQLNLKRVQQLPRDYTLVLSTIGQWSSARLVPGNQFGLGGAASVRGYDERIVNGDAGVSAQLELRSPSRHMFGRVPDKTQALLFFDSGKVWQQSPISGETNTSLASAGPGLRITVGKNGTLKADYGWQLNRISGTRSGRLHLSAVVNY
jgi:hemolysin activation/secretion protein